MIKRLSLCAALALPAVCHGQLDVSFTSAKSGFQTAPTTVLYSGGALRLDISDGSFQIAPCAFNGTTLADGAPFFPSQMPPCPLGTTAVVIDGDVDLDGFRDAGLFFSLPSAPLPASVIAPSHPELVTVISAPPSLFPRPGILPVVEGGAEIFYNVLDWVDQRNYQIAGYVHQQNFLATEAERARHDRTVVTGTYKLGLPGLLPANAPLGTPNQQVVVSLTKFPMPESWPGLTQSPLDWGFRFTNDDNWSNGAMEFDPRVANDITWQGIHTQNSFDGADEVIMWFAATQAADMFQLPAFPTDPNVVFPPSGSPFRLPNIRIGYYRLPQFFFTPGDEAFIYIRFDRNQPSTLVTSDTSVRVWGVPIRFIDSYEGFKQLGFPANTPDNLRLPTGDFDGDGATNLMEFALGTDMLDPLDNPTAAGSVVPFVNMDGKCEVTITKRPNAGGSLKYEVEYSGDMVTWTKVTPADPDWVIVTDDETVLTVRSVSDSPPAPCFIRAAITQQ
ncbi:MAG: hypothetical protein ACPG6P_08880 [Akkermansiaceae bacterium]